MTTRHGSTGHQSAAPGAVAARIRVIGLLAAFVGGALVAIQSRINGALGTRLHNGLAAALISFGSGLLVLVIVALVHRRTRSQLSAVRRAVRDHRLLRWQLLGSISGGSGLPGVILYFPVWLLSARTVATTRAAAGHRSE